MDGERNKYNLLEQMLVDSNRGPVDLPLSLLKEITKDFSEDKKIGSGGFANVYQGVLRNGSVAVKKLFQTINVDEEDFMKEVTTLIAVKHQNVVRFLGYCAESQGKFKNIGSKTVMADVQQRLLCFEFMPNGSLDNLLNNVASDGLRWRTYYQIIKGLCQGLHYLHEQRVVHRDLKPQNILLDCNMMPKISDFGLSRILDDEKSRVVTVNFAGTLGYMAPEYINRQEITIKSDIYSLGIIIIEILTGQRGYLPIESVLESWSTRFQMSHGGLLFEHARLCAKISLECIHSDPEKRPNTLQIIKRLDEIERTYGSVETNHSAIPVLDVYPLHIWFPLESDEVISWPVTLTNKTEDLIGVFIAPSTLNACKHPGFSYAWKHRCYCINEISHCTSLERHSSHTIYMTTRDHPIYARKEGKFDVVMVTAKSERDLRSDLKQHWIYAWSSIMTQQKCSMEHPLERAKNTGNVAHLATLTAAATTDPARFHEEAVHLSGWSTDGNDICCMDVHPTEKWLLVGFCSTASRDAYALIWNYKTQETVMEFDVKYLKESKDVNRISSIKFIARELWFAGGDAHGGVHVYAYDPSFRAKTDKVIEFEAHFGKEVTALAVYPKHTLLLTESSDDKSIKLWDWSQGWTCARVIDEDERVVHGLNLDGPRDISTFATCIGGLNQEIKVWDIHSSYAIARFEGRRPTFCTDGRLDFLVSLCDDYYKESVMAKIWDLVTKKHVHTLHPGIHGFTLTNLACHPTLPILAGIMENRYNSKEYHIVLWDVRTYRVMKTVQLLMEGTYSQMLFDGMKDKPSLVVTSSKQILVIKIDVHKLWISQHSCEISKTKILTAPVFSLWSLS